MKPVISESSFVRPVVRLSGIASIEVEVNELSPSRLNARISYRFVGVSRWEPMTMFSNEVSVGEALPCCTMTAPTVPCFSAAERELSLDPPQKPYSSRL